MSNCSSVLQRRQFWGWRSGNQAGADTYFVPLPWLIMCLAPKGNNTEGAGCASPRQSKAMTAGDGISDLNWAGKVYAFGKRDASDLFVSRVSTFIIMTCFGSLIEWYAHGCGPIGRKDEILLRPS